jgi:hypothetical protein
MTRYLNRPPALNGLSALEIDYKRAVSFHFVMRHVPGSKSVVVSVPKVISKPK